MSDGPIVKVEQGELQGKVVNSPSGKPFCSFQGIPYAKAPLGSLRFKAPQAAEHWDGVRDATAEGNVSAQIDPYIHKQEFIGDENCLFLNVYTPNLDGEFLPVMVFIHGGGFRFGSGNTSFYGCDYLVERDVVVVTINYRCGPLGFLCLNTSEVPGNAGLKDMVQALRWVTDNIGNFGGNSRNITVFGESCGGVATSILTASPLSKNLINKAIIQSGTALNSWAFQKNPIENAKKLAKVLGSEAEDIDEIFDFLSAVSVREIVDASEKLNPTELFFEKGINMFAPVVEKEFPGVDAAFTESFVNILTSGRTAQVPILIGSTALEFTYGTCPDDLRVFIPENLNINLNSEEAIEIAKNIKNIYFTSGKTGVESLPEYYNLLSDKLVNIDTYRYVKYLVQVSTKPVYLYRFDYVGELNMSKKLMDSLGFKQAAHMDELGYIFKNIFQEDVEPTYADIRMRERMLSLWTNFAKTGNPTPEETQNLAETWLPVTKDNLYAFNLSDEISLESINHNKLTFWEELYNKYYKIWEQPINGDAIKSDTIKSDISQCVANDQTEANIVAEAENHNSSEEENRNNTDVTDGPEAKSEDVKAETVQPETAQPEIVQLETVQPEPVQSETVQPEPVQSETIQPEPEQSEAVKPEPLQAESIQPESVLSETAQPESMQHETAQAESGQPESVETETVKADMVKPDEISTVEVKAAKDAEITKDIEQNGIKVEQTLVENGQNEVKVQSNGVLVDIIRANDPPEDDLPKNIGVNKFVSFFESLGKNK